MAFLFLRALVLTAVLLLALPMAIAQTSPRDGFDYRLEITCSMYAAQCPVQVIDGADALGDPAIAVDPFQPLNLIIASLHGGGDNPDAPSPKSRSGQTFTTHTSSNGGGGWVDKPFFPPDQIRAFGQAYGEHPAITISPYGQPFVGSLFSVPRSSDGAAGFDYVLSAQKFRSLRNINDNQDTSGDYNAQFLTSLFPGNAIRQMWYTYNPVTDNMTIVWTEQVTGHSAPVTDGMPRVFDTFAGAVDALRDEAAQAERLADLPTGLLGRSLQGDRQTEPMSTIGIAWTDLRTKSKYHFQELDDAIGPCETSTNPVIREGYLYIGCKVADEGTFRWNPAAEPGDIEMFRMDPDGGTPQYLGPAPVSGGNPKIGVRSDGRIALMTVAVEDGELLLDAVYGQLQDSTGRIAWGPVIPYGPEVREIDGRQVVDANVQDMLYREYSGVIHLILKRVLEGDLEANGFLNPLQPKIHKTLLAIDEHHGLIHQHGLDIGNIMNRTRDSTLMGQSDAVFNDISDDFLELMPLPYRYEGESLGENYQREFFAVGDYGFVIFAEVVEITDLRGPGAVTTALPPPASPAPAPAAVSSTAVAGAVSAAGVTSLVAARMHRLAAVGAKKKR